MKSAIVSRPAFVFCAVFFVTALISAGVPHTTKLILILSLIAVAVVSAIFVFLPPAKRDYLKIIVALCLSAVLGLGLTYLTTDRAKSSCESLDGQEVDCTLTVREVVYSAEYYGVYYADIQSEDGSVNKTVRLKYHDGSVAAGDVLRGSLSLSLIEEEELHFTKKEGVFLTAEPDSLEYVRHEDGRSIRNVLTKLNFKLYLSLQRATEGKATLTGAIMLGNTSGLKDTARRDFSRLGISHLFALSGLHMSVVVVFVSTLLSRTKLPKPARGVVTAAAIISFMAITGFSVSILRSGLMHLIIIVSHLLGRKGDTLTSLAFAASIIILLDPFAVFDTALLLSVLATYGCVSFQWVFKKQRSEARGRKSRLARVISGSVKTAKMSAFIVLLTLPFTVDISGGLPILAPLSNVIFIPLIGLLLNLGMIFLPLCRLPFVSAALALVVTSLEGFITWLAERLSSIPHIVLPLHSSVADALIVLVFLAAVSLGFIKKRYRVLPKILLNACTLLLLISSALTLYQASTTTRVTLATVGKNEGFVIENGLSTIAVDVTSGGLTPITSVLKSGGSLSACEISTLVLTHYHQRHISGVASLCDRANVREILLPSPESEGNVDICEALLRICRDHGIKATLYSRTTEEACDSAGVSFTFEEYELLSRSTHPIVSFSFTLGGEVWRYVPGASAESDVSVAEAGTVFVGAHPPVGKKPISILSGGNIVVSAGSADIVSAESATYLEADGVYTAKKSD